MRWLAVALAGCGWWSLACSGAGTGPSPLDGPGLPAPADYLGFTLGEPADGLAAKLPADAKRKTVDGVEVVTLSKKWRGRTWAIALTVHNGRVGEILIFSDGTKEPIDDVLGWASTACDAFAPGDPKVAGWAGAPASRYATPFKSSVSNKIVTVGCASKSWERFTMTAADSIVVLGAAEGVPTSPMMAKIAAARETFVPFAWGEAPHVGDAIESNGLRFRIDSITPAQSVGANPYLRDVATDGAFFVRVDFTIENIGNATTLVVASQLDLRDLKGRTFRPSSSATTTAAAEAGVDLLLSELQPGIPRKQIAVFEVPEEDRPRLDLLVAGAAMPLTFTP